MIARITVIFALLSILFPLVSAESVSVDRTGNVATVIDGSSFQLGSGDTIKLAAINTPVSGQAGYSESKNYLMNLIQGKTVYLNTGTAPTTDQQGRLLCVAYLDYNSTHYENVNMAMIQNGYAALNSQIINGFDPGTWTWFILKQTPTNTPSATNAPQSTETPTPTPFSQPSPSINPTIPELSTSIAFLIAMLTTMLVAAQLFKKKKKVRKVFFLLVCLSLFHSHSH